MLEYRHTGLKQSFECLVAVVLIGLLFVDFHYQVFFLYYSSDAQKRFLCVGGNHSEFKCHFYLKT